VPEAPLLVSQYKSAFIALSRVSAVPSIYRDQRAEAFESGDPTGERRAARSLLRWLLATTVSVELSASSIEARPKGQPYLTSHPAVGISVSHTAGWVAAAVNPCGAVGVDVQVPVVVSDSMLRRCCTPLGRSLLRALNREARELEFAWLWSIQESCVKASGGGLSDRPWRIALTPGQTSGRWRSYTWESQRSRSDVPLSCAVDSSVAEVRR